MKTVALTCNQCGAPIQAPESLRFVTCSHCNTRLKILSSGGAVYTELLEDIRGAQQEMAADLDTIQLQNELERVDREWERTERSFERVDKYGRRRLPSKNPAFVAVVAGVMIVPIVVFFVLSSMFHQLTAGFSLMLVGIVVFVLLAVMGAFKDSARFAEAQRRHRKRRRKVLMELKQRGALRDEP